jgi:hypothetical protein
MLSIIQIQTAVLELHRNDGSFNALITDDQIALSASQKQSITRTVKAANASHVTPNNMTAGQHNVYNQAATQPRVDSAMQRNYDGNVIVVKQAAVTANLHAVSELQRVTAMRVAAAATLEETRLL